LHLGGKGRSGRRYSDYEVTSFAFKWDVREPSSALLLFLRLPRVVCKLYIEVLAFRLDVRMEKLVVGSEEKDFFSLFSTELNNDFSVLIMAHLTRVAIVQERSSLVLNIYSVGVYFLLINKSTCLFEVTLAQSQLGLVSANNQCVFLVTRGFFALQLIQILDFQTSFFNIIRILLIG
jgi:hypothetical protein